MHSLYKILYIMNTPIPKTYQPQDPNLINCSMSNVCSLYHNNFI